MSQVRKPGFCEVVSCKNTIFMTENKPSFYFFPQNPERRYRWIIALRRRRRNGSPFTPPPNARICGDHFILGKPHDHPRHPDYVPTLFPFNKKDWYFHKQKILAVGDLSIKSTKRKNKCPPCMHTMETRQSTKSTVDKDKAGKKKSTKGMDDANKPSEEEPPNPKKRNVGLNREQVMETINKIMETQNTGYNIVQVGYNSTELLCLNHTEDHTSSDEETESINSTVDNNRPGKQTSTKSTISTVDTNCKKKPCKKTSTKSTKSTVDNNKPGKQTSTKVSGMTYMGQPISFDKKDKKAVWMYTVQGGKVTNFVRFPEKGQILQQNRLPLPTGTEVNMLEKSSPVSTTPVMTSPDMGTPGVGTSVVGTPVVGRPGEAMLAASTSVSTIPVTTSPDMGTLGMGTSVASTPVMGRSFSRTPVVSRPVVAIVAASTSVSTPPVVTTTSARTPIASTVAARIPITIRSTTTIPDITSVSTQIMLSEEFATLREERDGAMSRVEKMQHKLKKLKRLKHRTRKEKLQKLNCT